MAGKSGEVKIRFDYYNNSNETVKVKGKNYNVKTPFTMVTGMILSSDVFSNIEVMFCMPLEEGQKLVESLDGVEAMWCTPDKQATTSSGWNSHLKK